MLIVGINIILIFLAFNVANYRNKLSFKTGVGGIEFKFSLAKIHRTVISLQRSVA